MESCIGTNPEIIAVSKIASLTILSVQPLAIMHAWMSQSKIHVWFTIVIEESGMGVKKFTVKGLRDSGRRNG